MAQCAPDGCLRWRDGIGTHPRVAKPTSATVAISGMRGRHTRIVTATGHREVTLPGWTLDELPGHHSENLVGNRVLDSTPNSSSLKPVATPYTAMLK